MLTSSWRVKCGLSPPPVCYLDPPEWLYIVRLERVSGGSEEVEAGLQSLVLLLLSERLQGRGNQGWSLSNSPSSPTGSRSRTSPPGTAPQAPSCRPPPSLQILNTRKLEPTQFYREKTEIMISAPGNSRADTLRSRSPSFRVAETSLYWLYCLAWWRTPPQRILLMRVDLPTPFAIQSVSITTTNDK